MTIEDEFKLLVSGYYGVFEMDEYNLKQYVLKDIEDYIRNFISLNPLSNFDYAKTSEDIKDNVFLKTKLQDSLLVLRKINGPLELILMIKNKIEELK